MGITYRKVGKCLAVLEYSDCGCVGQGRVTREPAECREIVVDWWIGEIDAADKVDGPAGHDRGVWSWRHFEVGAIYSRGD